MSDPEVPRPRKRSTKWQWVTIVLIGAAAAAAVLVPRGASDPNAAPPIPTVVDKPAGVGASGRIEPEDGVMIVAGAYFSGRPSIVRELRIKEGDWVNAGQIVAVLDGWETLGKALRQSEAEAEVALTRLALVKAGVKAADLEAQRAEISRWESEYKAALLEQARVKKLYESDLVPKTDLEADLLVERNNRLLAGAKERLKSLEDIRKEEIDVRAAEHASAIARVEQGRSELERMIVRAPAQGKVLKIRAYPGEEAGSQGIFELGRTDRMYVIAEVYETDISRIRIGQKAEISGDLLAQPLTGTVTQIDSQVTKSELLPIDTISFADTRVVKVKIKLDSSENAAGLIGGKVAVVIKSSGI